jgi:hypothetical protein
MFYLESQLHQPFQLRKVVVFNCSVNSLLYKGQCFAFDSVENLANFCIIRLMVGN